jgi:hypothetical protein
MVLWGIAFCLVGVLIAGVSGFCGFWVLKDGSPVQDLGGTFAAGFGIGIFLCIAGYLMMRGRNL